MTAAPAFLAAPVSPLRLSAALSRVAIHEAGHVVAAERLGRRIAYVHLSAPAPTRGRFRLADAGVLPPVWRRDFLPAVHRWLTILLAGPAAEAEYVGEVPDVAPLRWQEDVNTAQALAIASGSTRDIQAGLYYAAERRARRLMREPDTWRAVERVARRLTMHRRLEGEQVRELLAA